MQTAPTFPSRRRGAVCLALALCLLHGVSEGGRAAGQVIFDADEVKAAFLYNFMRFVEWRASADGSTARVICTTGRGGVGDALDALLRTRPDNGRPIAVRQLGPDDDPRACHSVFLAASEPQRSADILARVRNADVLTVGETAQFLAEGGLVRFYVSDNRVRFQIDAVGARTVGLRISPQLLSLAK